MVVAPGVRSVWAKAGNGGTPHPLICHALDTAAVAELIYHRLLGPVLRERLDAALAPLGEAPFWAAALSGLHDLGKCSPSFQGLRADLAEKLLPEADWSDVQDVLRDGRLRPIRTDMPHGVLTAVHVKRLLLAWGTSTKTAHVLAQVLGGHHGYLPSAGQIQSGRSSEGHGGEKDWEERCDELTTAYLRLWGVEAPQLLPWNEVTLDVHAQLALGALTTVSDWIASSRPEREYAGENVDLVGYAAGSRAAEAERVALLSWDPWVPPEDTTFAGLFPEHEPRSVQKKLEEAVEQCDGPGIFVVSAPTGEGKTKAGLQAVAALAASRALSGFYLAMPSKVSGNQGYEVARQVLGAGGQAQLLHLFHSSADEYLQAREPDPPKLLSSFGVAPDGDGGQSEDEEDEEHPTAQSWFSSRRKRTLLASVGVGTVDQSLMAAIRSGHVFVRLAGLSSKVVLFDEVHSYDVHMSTLFHTLLHWLGSMHVPVVILSATLSTTQQHELVRSWRAGALRSAPPDTPVQLATDAPHSRILWTDVDGAAPRHIAVRTSALNQNRVVSLERVDFHDRVRSAMDEAALGRSVAVVHNVVAHAEAAWSELKKMTHKLPEERRPLILRFHSKLSAKERAQTEAVLREHYGAGATDRRPAVIVGSPLLEQSLDLDFDLVISAVAPVDGLIQRMGRIHRHRAVAEGERLRMVLTGWPGQGGSRAAFPPNTAKVYEKSLLLRTCAVLDGRTTVRCPDEVQDLIDMVYDLDGAGAELVCPAGWEKEWREAESGLRSRRGNESQLGSQTYEPQMIGIPIPGPRMGLHELTDKPESPRRTRRDSGPRRGPWR